MMFRSSAFKHAEAEGKMKTQEELGARKKDAFENNEMQS